MISTQLQPALTTLASTLSVNPSAGASSIRGACTAIQASRRITIAATMISDAREHRAEVLGLVVAERVVGVGRLGGEPHREQRRQAVTTFTMLSSASE